MVRAFELGTGAFAVRLDVGRHLVRVRHYDARMVVLLSWDAEGVRECAFVTRCFSRGALSGKDDVLVIQDNSITQDDTASEKQQDMEEVSAGAARTSGFSTSGRRLNEVRSISFGGAHAS